MDNNELEIIINRKLEKYGMPRFDLCKTNIQKYLIKIETQIQEVNSKREKAMEEYKSSRINILSISKNCNISRQTIYNNREILEKYIQFSQEEFDKNDFELDLNEKDEAIKEMKEIIAKLYDRDLKEQLKLDSVHIIELENKSLLKELQILNRKNEMLQIELDKLKLKLREKSNLVNFKGKDEVK